jgi:hypothetical protein
VQLHGGDGLRTLDSRLGAHAHWRSWQQQRPAERQP